MKFTFSRFDKYTVKIPDYTDYIHLKELVNLGYNYKNEDPIETNFSPKVIHNWFELGIFSKRVYQLLKYLQYIHLEAKSIEYILIEGMYRENKDPSKIYTLLPPYRNYRATPIISDTLDTYKNAMKYINMYPDILQDKYIIEYICCKIIKLTENNPIEYNIIKMIDYMIPSDMKKKIKVNMKGYASDKLDKVLPKYEEFEINETLIGDLYEKILPFKTGKYYSLNVNNNLIKGVINHVELFKREEYYYNIIIILQNGTIWYIESKDDFKIIYKGGKKPIKIKHSVVPSYYSDEMSHSGGSVSCKYEGISYSGTYMDGKKHGYFEHKYKVNKIYYNIEDTWIEIEGIIYINGEEHDRWHYKK